MLLQLIDGATGTNCALTVAPPSTVPAAGSSTVIGWYRR